MTRSNSLVERCISQWHVICFGHHRIKHLTWGSQKECQSLCLGWSVVKLVSFFKEIISATLYPTQGAMGCNC